MHYNNTVIDNNYLGLQGFILLFKFSVDTRMKFFKANPYPANVENKVLPSFYSLAASQFFPVSMTVFPQGNSTWEVS